MNVSARILHKRPGTFGGYHPGLTLIEGLVLIVVLALTVLLILNQPGPNNNNGKISAARLFTTQEIDYGLQQYRTDTGTFPTTAQGLGALINPPADVTSWRGPYIKISSIPLDPWKNPYRYAFPSAHQQPAGKYDCWSLGPDGINGTADDIGNWK